MGLLSDLKSGITFFHFLFFIGNLLELLVVLFLDVAINFDFGNIR